MTRVSGLSLLLLTLAYGSTHLVHWAEPRPTSDSTSPEGLVVMMLDARMEPSVAKQMLKGAADTLYSGE